MSFSSQTKHRVHFSQMQRSFLIEITLSGLWPFWVVGHTHNARPFAQSCTTPQCSKQLIASILNEKVLGPFYQIRARD